MARTRLLVTLLLVVATWLTGAGCGDDDPVAPAAGTVEVAVSPDHLPAGWFLVGPDGFEHAGQGGATLDDLAPGDYTVVWADMDGWITPEAETAVLGAGGTATFSGIYLLDAAAPATADAAMLIFRDAYAGRQLERYSLLLSPDFLFVDQDSGVDDRDQEIAITERIFHGIPGDNSIVISHIAVNQLQPLSTWAPTPENDPIFGGFDSLYRSYNVDFSFFVAGQNLILRVQGPALFYVTDAGNGGWPDYEILGIVDATYGNKATENHSWSALRALFD